MNCGGGDIGESVRGWKEEHVRNACLQLQPTAKHAPQTQCLLRFLCLSRCRPLPRCLLPPPLFFLFNYKIHLYGTVSPLLLVVSIMLLGNCLFSLGFCLFAISLNFQVRHYSNPKKFTEDFQLKRRSIAFYFYNDNFLKEIIIFFSFIN